MEETSVSPVPLTGNANSSSRFVLAPLEEQPSEAQRKLVPIPNLSVSGTSFRDRIACPRFFSESMSRTSPFWEKEHLVAKGEGLAQERMSFHFT